MPDFRNSDDDLVTAMEHLYAGRYEEALTLLARVVSFKPDDEEAYAAWIDAHMGAKRYRRALQIAEEGIAQGRDRASMLVWKALAHSKLAETDHAENALRAALEAEPDFQVAAISLSYLLEEQDRLGDALDILLRFDAQNPGSEEICFRAVELATALDRDTLVVELARRYLKQFGKHPDVLHWLGIGYVVLDDHKRAERALRDAIMEDPDHPEYHMSLLAFLLGRGKEKEAVRHIDSLRERDPELADFVMEEIDRMADEEEAESRPGQKDESI